MAKKNEEMTWEELEKVFGIRIEKPTEENRKVATDAGVSTPTARKEENSLGLERQDREIAEPHLPEGVEWKKPEPLPRMEKPRKLPPKETRRSVPEPVVVQSEEVPEMVVRRETPTHVSRASRRMPPIGRMDLKKAVLWSEILQPPLAKRKR